MTLGIQFRSAVKYAVVGNHHHRTPACAHRREVRLVLLLHEVDCPEEHRLQALGNQVRPGFKNVADLVEQRIRIEFCRTGEEGKNVGVTVAHDGGGFGIPTQQGGNRLGCLGEGESFG